MRDLFRCDGPTIINVSGGRTSALMLRRVLDAHGGTLPANVHAVFANTGAEHEGTLDFLAECADRWGVDLRWIERTREAPGWREVTFDTASRESEPFEELVLQRKFLPNAVMRFCTQALKIETAASFMRSQGYDRWTSVVGLRADEPQRVAKIRARDHGDWDVACPLADAGVTVGDVAAYWRASPFDLRIAPHEGNCVGCFLKSTGKRRRIAEDTPERLAWWAAMEARIGARFRKDGPGYQQLLDDAASQGRLHLAVVDDDLTVCGCTDRRVRRCTCGGSRTRGHALSCGRSTWAVAA